MQQEIKTICLPMPLRMGSVNCYLITTDAGCILIDTGISNKRNDLERDLEIAGCTPCKLQLIVITHGDFDHTGNAAYLRAKYGALIGMHPDDLGMIEHGDMFWNRETGNALLGKVAGLLFGFGKSKRCKPDLSLNEGDSLMDYGFEARVLSLPGHSKGSIGVLTADGALFCGDLLENSDKPAPGSLVDNREAASASIERIQGLAITTVYPGHGKPFPIEALRV